MKKYVFILAIISMAFTSYAQFGAGMVITTDLYNRYLHPTDDIADRSAGSAVLNLGIGPKIWVGGKKFSVSLESTANLGLLGLSFKDYKGLGSVSFPMMAKLNFNGASSLGNSSSTGFSLGGGLQYSKSELYYLANKYEDKGVERKLFKTYIAELGFGFGLSGVYFDMYFRYGFHPEDDARTYNMGIAYNFNFRKTSKIDKPESKLY